MKKLFFKILFLTLVVFAPVSAMADVSIHIGIPLPPPIVFPAPPEMIVIPETEVYVVPDVEDEIFFYGGWWWRPWQGRWYRSHYYDRGWVYYQHEPYFHRHIPPGWRNDYRNHHWKGQRWEYRRIPHPEVQRQWNGWKRDRHWERQGWGVKGLSPRQKHKYYRDKPYKKRNDQPGQPYRGKGPGDNRPGRN